MTSRLNFFYIIVVLFFSCSRKDETEPVNAFFQIYDKQDVSGKLTPLDLASTSDGGHLILARKNGWNIYLMKADAEGNFIWEQIVGESYVNPVSGLFSENGQFLFFAMEKLTLQSVLMSIDPATGGIQVVKSFPELYYPLSVSEADNGYLLQGYDHEKGNTFLTKIDSNLEIQWKQLLPTGKPREEEIIGHVTGTGKRYPFFTGEAGGEYYVNTFHQYNLNLVFGNSATGNTTGGVVYGFDENAGMNSLLPLNEGFYAFSRFSEGGQFINPQGMLNSNAVLIADELPGTNVPEISNLEEVDVERLAINGKDLIIFSTSTKSNNAAFYAFHASSGAQAGSLYLGHTFPYTSPCISLNINGEPVVAAATEVAGKFSRLVLFKLSESQIAQLISQ